MISERAIHMSMYAHLLGVSVPCLVHFVLSASALS